jgi:hypothetical protein
MKNYNFLHIKPRNQVKVNGRFGKTCRLHLRGWKVSQARSRQQEELCLPLSVDFHRNTLHSIPEDRTLLNIYLFNIPIWLNYQKVIWSVLLTKTFGTNTQGLYITFRSSWKLTIQLIKQVWCNVLTCYTDSESFRAWKFLRLFIHH